MMNFRLFSLLESILEVNYELVEILKYLDGKGDVIAQKIYPLIKKDIKTHVNYLKPANQDDMFFIPDSQVEKTKEKGADLWDSKNKAKVGRTWRQILRDNNISYLDSDIEKFVNNYKNAYKKIVLKETEDEFRLVKGREIQYWYLEDNYVSGGGTLNNSCMRYEDCQDFFDIYILNPEVCQLLILVNDDNLLLGRALVWKLTSGEYYLDRIYTRYDSDVDRFEEFFEDKFHSSMMYDRRSLKKMLVQLKHQSLHYFPYMDTFQAFDPKSSLLSSHSIESDEVTYELTSTDGEYYYNGEWSDYEGEYIPYSQCVSVNGYGYVHVNNTEISGFDGDRILLDDVVDSVYGPIDIRKSLEVDDQWIPNKDICYIKDGDDWKAIPLKWYLEKNQINNPIFVYLEGGEKALVKKEEIFYGFFNSLDKYQPEYKKTGDDILFYEISDSVLKGIDIDWRESDYSLANEIGFIDGSPIIIRYGKKFIIDEYMNEEYKLSDQIIGYTGNKVSYLRDIYYSFNPLTDFFKLEIYDLNEKDITYINGYDKTLQIAFEKGPEYMMTDFKGGIDESLKILGEDFSLDEIKRINYSIFSNLSDKYNDGQILQSILMYRIFIGVSRHPITDFLKKKNLPYFSYWDEINLNKEIQIKSLSNRYLFDRSNEDSMSFIFPPIFELAFEKIKKFCSANNL